MIGDYGDASLKLRFTKHVRQDWDEEVLPNHAQQSGSALFRLQTLSCERFDMVMQVGDDGCGVVLQPLPIEKGSEIDVALPNVHRR